MADKKIYNVGRFGAWSIGDEPYNAGVAQW